MLATGCNKTSEPPKPDNSSVALPERAMPPSDAAIKTAPPEEAAPTPDFAKQSQANPVQLSKPQESAAMPMPGQANDHSTPDPLNNAKK